MSTQACAHPVILHTDQGHTYVLVRSRQTHGIEEPYMFNQLLPQRIDNTYRGYRLALWLFGLLLVLKVTMSLNSIFICSPDLGSSLRAALFRAALW